MSRLTLKQRVGETWKKLLYLNARPDQIAAGFSIGIIASFLPLNPSPIAVATVVAWLLKMSVIAAIAGATTAILYSPLLPLIWLAEYRLGKLILPVRRPLALDHARLWEVLQKGWDAYAAMLIGSIIIAAPVTLVTFVIVNQVATRWARKRNSSYKSD